MSELNIQHIGYDIPYDEPEPEDPDIEVRKQKQQLAKAILSKFSLATRIMIVEAVWGIDVEKELNLCS
jgi:hypothetical protein